MKTSIAIIGCCCAALHAQSADVTQFRGEGHLGAFPETGLLKAWPENGPKRGSLHVVLHLQAMWKRS